MCTHLLHASTYTSTGESPQGPVVKLIMDHPRCAQLREGDIILEVNMEKVVTYVHSNVVQVLTQCANGIRTNFLVLRDVSQQAEVCGADQAAGNSTVPHLMPGMVTY